MYYTKVLRVFASLWGTGACGCSPKYSWQPVLTSSWESLPPTLTSPQISIRQMGIFRLWCSHSTHDQAEGSEQLNCWWKLNHNSTIGAGPTWYCHWKLTGLSIPGNSEPLLYWYMNNMYRVKLGFWTKSFRLIYMCLLFIDWCVKHW